jgi:hypothetical protein
LPAIYFLGTAAFALLNSGQFASETPQFHRYVLFPGVNGVVLVAAAIIAPARLSMNLGTSVLAVLGGCLAFEAVMTVKVVAVLLGSCFMGTDIEQLVIGNFVLRKEEQDKDLSQVYRDRFELD